MGSTSTVGVVASSAARKPTVDIKNKFGNGAAPPPVRVPLARSSHSLSRSPTAPSAAANSAFWSAAVKALAAHTCRLNGGVRRGERGVMRATSIDAGASSDDLLIVGPGVLGAYLGKLWLDEHPTASVVGQTNTATNHDRLRALGLTPRLNADANGRTFPFVVFCAPPSGSTDYVGDIKAAVRRWDGTGSFVFTSSAGVYAVDDGSACDESSPVQPRGNPRTDMLMDAENAVTEAGGNVVRLSGLYHAGRGAHTFFLRQGSVQRWGGYTVNLIHYEDAARLALAVLRGDGTDGFYRGRTFLGTDGTPVTFLDMMDATLASGVFEGTVTFTGEAGSAKGKLMTNPATRQALHWQPKYPSFAGFMAGGAKDWYSETGLLETVGAAHKG